MREVIETDAAPAAVGPYSQAIVTEGHVHTSGQIALDPSTGRMVDGGVEDEARQALSNLAAVLEAAGSSLDRVVKVTVFLTDMGDFESVNRVYTEFFQSARPARSCVGVSQLPKGARIEVEAVALR